MLGLILLGAVGVYVDYRRNKALRIKYSDLHRYRVSPKFNVGSDLK
jgi:hypothetical protein